MLIRFCLDDGGNELFSLTSNDIAGVIEASKGEKVVFHDDWYEYDNHVLNHYVENGKWYQEVIIYLKDYNS